MAPGRRRAHGTGAPPRPLRRRAGRARVCRVPRPPTACSVPRPFVCSVAHGATQRGNVCPSLDRLCIRLRMAQPKRAIAVRSLDRLCVRLRIPQLGRANAPARLDRLRWVAHPTARKRCSAPRLGRLVRDRLVRGSLGPGSLGRGRLWAWPGGGRAGVAFGRGHDRGRAAAGGDAAAHAEGVVRDRARFRIGRIVYRRLARRHHDGLRLPEKERDALVAAEPDKFLLPDLGPALQLGRRAARGD